MTFDFNGHFDAKSRKPESPAASTSMWQRDSDVRRQGHSRRSVLSLLTASMVVGCNTPNADQEESSASRGRTDVPLRILMLGSPADAEAIRVAWSMTMEQPLEIEAVAATAPTAFPADEDPATRFANQVMQADIAIAPQSYLGELIRVGAVVDLNDSLRQEYELEFGKLFPAVEDGLGAYGGLTWGIAVGAKLLALIALDSQVQCETWAAYHDWVKDLDGKAAEPMAVGWAATSFLNRCASTFTRNWLFNRSTLKPEIDSEDYIDALEQFAATAKLYPTDAMTPGEIWRAVRRGVLQGGIGYEVPDLADRSESDSRTGEQAGQQASVEDFEVSVFRCPLETEIDQVFFGPQTPLACLSSGCRQTDASKRMIGWLSGGERIAAVRQQSEPFSMVRRPPESETSQSGSAYSRWLAERLQTRQVARGLILPGASQYYTVLDREVLRCLAGEQSAKEALTGAALQWQAITDKIGRETQQVAWKKTLGFGG